MVYNNITIFIGFLGLGGAELNIEKQVWVQFATLFLNFSSVLSFSFLLKVNAWLKVKFFTLLFLNNTNIMSR